MREVNIMKFYNLKTKNLKNLRSYSLKSLGLLFAIFFLLNAVDSKINTAQGDDVEARQLRSIIIEGWEKSVWDVKAIPGAPAGIAESKLVDGRPTNLGNNSKNKKSMGVRFSFVYPGHNSIVLTPPKTKSIKRPTGQLDVNNQPIYRTVPGIELPGRIDSLSLWALGRGNAITLEVWIEDWRGDTFIGRFGSLDYIGWRPLNVKIPNYVPQRISSFPQAKSMVLKKLVIRSKPTTSQEEVVVFLDSLKVLSNVYDLYFDGAQMSFDDPKAKDAKSKETLSEYQKRLIQENQDN